MARPRSPDHGQQRATIVRTAARLFAERGYPGTSMADIAAGCGLSKALLYHYVDDKYRLLLDIAEGHVIRLDTLVDEVMRLGLAPEPRLRRLIGRFVDEYAGARHAHVVLTQDVKFLDGSDRDRVLDTERRVVAAFAATVAELRPALAQAALERPLAMLLFGMMNWLHTWLHPDGALAPPQLAVLVTELFLGGLGGVSPAAVTAVAAVSAVTAVQAVSA